MPVGEDRQGGGKVGYNGRMKTKPLTFLLALTFLFLFSGSVYGQEEVKKEYWDNGKLRTEFHYKNKSPTVWTWYYKTGVNQSVERWEKSKNDELF